MLGLMTLQSHAPNVPYIRAFDLGSHASNASDLPGRDVPPGRPRSMIETRINVADVSEVRPYLRRNAIE